MEDTWTALDSSAETAFGKAAERDENGDLVDPDATDPTMISYDFANVQDSDVTGGTLSVKAVYVPGEKLNAGSSGKFYTAIGPLEYGQLLSSSTSSTYSISFNYKRINEQGYGVTKARSMGVKMDLIQVGASDPTSLAVSAENGETIPVMLTPSNAVSEIGYQLKNTYDSNVIRGADISEENTLSDGQRIQLQGIEGVIFKFTLSTYLKQAYEGTVAAAGFTKDVFTALKLSADTKGTAISAAAKRKTATNNIKTLVATVGESYEDLTWYQIQYAVINSGEYVSNEQAKAYCEDKPALMANINS
jgi:hypothetical protein